MMTESEVLEIINLHASNTIYSFSIYVSLTFGYLIVAYFIGAKLSRFQLIIISSLYFVSAGTFSLSGFMHIQSFAALVDKYPTFIYTSLWNLPWLPFAIIITGGGMLICLLFMHDVRKG